MDLLLKKELQMMNQQARQYLAQSPSHLPLRWYGPNSPRARGRLVAVAMLADGQLNPAELHEIAEGARYCSASAKQRSADCCNGSKDIAV
jgi:hypothetical protein